MLQQQPSEIINNLQFQLLTFAHPCRHETPDEGTRIIGLFNLLLLGYFTLTFLWWCVEASLREALESQSWLQLPKFPLLLHFGMQAASCIMKIWNISLSLFCPLLQLLFNHTRITEDYTSINCITMGKMPLCAPHSSLQCGIGFPDTPSCLFMILFQ